jgi:hypothetical protein
MGIPQKGFSSHSNNYPIFLNLNDDLYFPQSNTKNLFIKTLFSYCVNVNMHTLTLSKEVVKKDFIEVVKI